MADIGEKLRPAIEPSLAADEQLEALCVCSRSGLVSGKFVVVGLTDRRLLIQATDRTQQPKGEPLALTAEQIVSAKIAGAGGFDGDLPSGIMNRTSLTIKLKTTGGDKLKLMLGKGGGGPLGGLMGGPTQEQGVRAVTEWLSRAA